MNRRDFLNFASTLIAVTGTAKLFAQDVQDKAGKSVTNLGEVLESIRKEHGFPGIAAAATRGDQVVAEGVAGVRRLEKDDPITIDDRFAIGSCTKLMTGLLIARLIDAGKLSFDTKLADALPKIKMADDYRDVTVAQLLNFTAGIQPYTQITPASTPVLFKKGGTPTERRNEFVEHVLNEEPVDKPGTKRNYSNAGYVILGQIAAECNGTELEDAMKQHVFTPLALARAGFGRPCTKDRPNEPWLHVNRGKTFVPEQEQEQRPVEVILAAAGDVHCSIRDLTKLAVYELLAAQGKDPLLKPETAKRRQELTNTSGRDDFTAFGGTPWLAAGVHYTKSKNLGIVFAINAGALGNPMQAVIKALRDHMADK